MSSTAVVMVPGAFRGAWMWEPVAALLREHGCDPRPVDLPGEPGGETPSLAEWIAAVVLRCDPRPRSTVVVGHSMGGVVAQAATSATEAIAHVVLLDAPLIRSGERAIDVSGVPPVETQLPPADTWLEPRAVGPEQGFDSVELAEWVNQRLSPTPFGPSLEPVTVDSAVPRTVVFFDRTPSYFPSALSRIACDVAGDPYLTVDTHHDGPMLDPASIASIIADVVTAIDEGR